MTRFMFLLSAMLLLASCTQNGQNHEQRKLQTKAKQIQSTDRSNRAQSAQVAPGNTGSGKANETKAAKNSSSGGDRKLTDKATWDRFNPSCPRCDTLFETYVYDPVEWQRLYAYGGEKMDEFYDLNDIYFMCLEKCFDYEVLVKSVKLVTEIKWDYDAPNIFGDDLLEILEKRRADALQVFREMECSSFKKFVAFEYGGVESRKALRKLCEFFSSFKPLGECKDKVIDEYCRITKVDH